MGRRVRVEPVSSSWQVYQDRVNVTGSPTALGGYELMGGLSWPSQLLALVWTLDVQARVVTRPPDATVSLWPTVEIVIPVKAVERIASRVTEQPVWSEITYQVVAARPATDDVWVLGRSGAANVAAQHIVVSRPSPHLIGARKNVDLVISQTRSDDVIVIPTLAVVIAASKHQDIVAVVVSYQIWAAQAHDPVGSEATVQHIAVSASAQQVIPARAEDTAHAHQAISPHSMYESLAHVSHDWVVPNGSVVSTR
jgi:hypothetical protein